MKKSSNHASRNIVLIGMPGCGKSTVGVILAKTMSRYFIDTDIYIQAIEGKPLQQLIDEESVEKFCQIEQDYILRIDVKNAVIATGGSVVYGQKAMEHLAKNSIVVHLDLDYGKIENRITNLYTRGVVMEDGQTLKTLYDKRQPIYQKYAQITIDCCDKTHEQIVDEIIRRLPK